MVLLSRRHPRNNDVMAKEWRNEVAYRSMIVLRTAVEVTNYNTNKIPAWDIAELSGSELQFAIDGHVHVATSGTTTGTSSSSSSVANSVIQEENAIFLDSLRVPTRMAYLLRESICSQEERLQHPMHIQLENKLLSSVDSIVQGYYGYVYCKCHFSLHLI